MFCLLSGHSWLLTRHQLSTSPELNSKSDLIIRVGTGEERAGFNLHAWGVCRVGVHTSTYVLLLSASGGQSGQNESHLELTKLGHKIQEEVAECLMLKLLCLVWWGLPWLWGDLGGFQPKNPTLCAPSSHKVNLSPWVVPVLTDASCVLDLCQITYFACFGSSPYKLCVITLFHLWKMVGES